MTWSDLYFINTTFAVYKIEIGHAVSWPWTLACVVPFARMPFSQSVTLVCTHPPVLCHVLKHLVRALVYLTPTYLIYSRNSFLKIPPTKGSSALEMFSPNFCDYLYWSFCQIVSKCPVFRNRLKTSSSQGMYPAHFCIDCAWHLSCLAYSRYLVYFFELIHFKMKKIRSYFWYVLDCGV